LAFKSFGKTVDKYAIFLYSRYSEGVGLNYNEKEDFSQFGKSFQENLCQLILLDRAFADQMKEILNINFLELNYLQVFVKKIFDYKDKYKMHPSVDIMTTILRADISGENTLTQKQVRDFFARMAKTSVQDIEYIQDTAVDFCKKQVLKEAMMKSIPLLRKSSFEDIQKLINDAMKLGTNNDYGYHYLKDFEKRFELIARDPITTGWTIVDKLCKGGLGNGELGVVIAPTGAGKSMALVHLGAQALKKGKNVIHYTLELADTIVATRYDSCITGIPLEEVYNKKDDIYEDIKDIEGQLIVKEYPTKSASVDTLRAHLDKLQQREITIDMIIVDYGDLLRSKRQKDEKRHQLESIYEELRAIAQENNCPVWTASQTNRSGLNAEVITMESISEAFNKCFVADFIFSLSRTIEHKSDNGGRLFIAKNRNGPDGLVYPIHMDTSKVEIDVLSQTETFTEIKKNILKKQEQSLQEKYKKFRKGKK
jgi:replicative DNA helicase